MSNSYFGGNYNLGIDYGKLKDFQLNSSTNAFTPNVGNMAGVNNEENKDNNKGPNAFQRWWRTIAPPVGESNNPSVNEGILTESSQSQWLGDFINSGGVLTDPTGQTTTIGDATNKDKKDKDADLEAEIAKEKREEEAWGRKVGKLEDIAKRGQRRQMIHGGLTGMGKSIMEGTFRGADSLDRAQAATAQMISNMPTLQLTAMKYAQLQDYGLG